MITNFTEQRNRKYETLIGAARDENTICEENLLSMKSGVDNTRKEEEVGLKALQVKTQERIDVHMSHQTDILQVMTVFLHNFSFVDSCTGSQVNGWWTVRPTLEI